MVDPPAMPSAKKAKGTATPNATAWPPMTRHGWAERPCGEMNSTNAVGPDRCDQHSTGAIRPGEQVCCPERHHERDGGHPRLQHIDP